MAKKINLNHLKEREILDTPIKRLDLSLENSWLAKPIQKLAQELGRRELLIKPRIWISDEWYSPDGVCGFAVPFYLLHPKLIRLERKHFFEAEGSNLSWCQKLMRHEAAHCLDNAFKLRKRKVRQTLFGKSTTKYPTDYSPKPYSRQYVVNLDGWYAQAHPDEDWAETFAVWLDPRSDWKNMYKKWPAIKKLNYVDEVMSEIKNQRPKNVCKQHDRTYKDIAITVGEYIENKKQHFVVEEQSFFTQDLFRLFAKNPNENLKIKASTFIRKNRKEIVRNISMATRQYQYLINQVVDEIIDLCSENNLWLKMEESHTLTLFMIALGAQLTYYLESGSHKFIM